MAGMVVTTTEITQPSVKKIIFAWTSDDAAGTATKTTDNVFAGKLIHFVTIPDAVAAPTDNYDITITDADGTDVLIGAGANRDTANTEQVASDLLGAVAGSKLTLNVAAAGNAKEGTVILYIR